MSESSPRYTNGLVDIAKADFVGPGRYEPPTFRARLSFTS
jgi:hypothetical protein